MCFVGQTYAATATYTNLIPTGSETDSELTAKQVTFNGYQWYIIEDNSGIRIFSGVSPVFAKNIRVKFTEFVSLTP